MKNSDILFCAGSAFSHFAAYSGRQKLVFDVDKGTSLLLNNCITISTLSDDQEKISSTVIQEINKHARDNSSTPNTKSSFQKSNTP